MAVADPGASAPRYAWYGDDFTGASDTLATLAAGGRRALLFLRVPTAAQWRAAGALDAVGVAGIARALDPEAMAAELAPVAEWFEALAPAITHYKCCSTFDSAPRAGNLVQGVAVLRRARHDPLLAVLGGQPSLGRFCAFGQLFASAGAGGPVHRIDRHPTMSVHPVTPMHEADLRLHLGALGLSGSALLDFRALDAAADGDLDISLDATAPPALLFDSTRAEHLAPIGRWLWRRAQQRPLLALGASSVAQAALAAWPGDSGTPAAQGAVAAATGPVFVLVGSQSRLSAQQAEAAAGAFEVVRLEPAQLLEPAAREALAQACAVKLREGRPVLAHTSVATADGPAPLAVAQASAALLARVLALAPPVRRVGIAGGDTSSFALRALQGWGLGWIAHLAPGVALTRLHADEPALDGLELMLKGGQMGGPELFLQLLKGTPA